MTLKELRNQIKTEERTLSELIGKTGVLPRDINIDQILYEKVGIVVVTTSEDYLMEKRISITPKVLYLSGKEVNEDHYNDEYELGDALFEGSVLYLDIDKRKSFGTIANEEEIDLQIYGAGMGMENAGILTFYSDVNSENYPDIWIEESGGGEEDGGDGDIMKYFIYEVWIKKIICNIRRQINTDLLFEMVAEKVEMLKKNNYSKNSYMYRDTQFNLDTLLRATYVNQDITRESLICRFGDIAYEENMNWLKDAKLCENFNQEVGKYFEYLDEEREPITDEEKWMEHFRYNEAHTSYSSTEISRRFKEYYKEYTQK